MSADLDSGMPPPILQYFQDFAPQYFALPFVKIYFDPPRVEIAEGVTLDEAARRFWDTVSSSASRPEEVRAANVRLGTARDDH